MITTKQVLEKAAEVAERLEHCKGRMTIRDYNKIPTACCILGAIQVAVEELGLHYASRSEAFVTTEKCYRALYAAKPEFKDGIGVWNDGHKTTKSDVVAFLRSTAAGLPPK